MSVLDTLIAERAKYAERINTAQADAILNAACLAHRRYKRLKKTIGNHYQGRSVDYLVDTTTRLHHDVLEDAPDAFAPYEQASEEAKPHYRDGQYWGTAKPYWGEGKPMEDESRWLDPIEPDAPVPNPGTPVPTPGTDCADAHAAMVEQIGALTELVNDWLKEAERFRVELAASRIRMDALEQRNADVAKPRVYTFSAGTGRTWGHSHPVSFTVEL